MDEKYLQDLYKWTASVDNTFTERYDYDSWRFKLGNSENYRQDYYKWLSSVDPTVTERRPYADWVNSVTPEQKQEKPKSIVVESVEEGEPVKKKSTLPSLEGKSPRHSSPRLKKAAEKSSERANKQIQTWELLNMPPSLETKNNYTKIWGIRDVGRDNGPGQPPSTVLMASGESDGKHVAFPTLFPKDPNNYTPNPEDWIELEGDEAFEEAKKRDEVFFFNSKNEAEAFALGSWKEFNPYESIKNFRGSQDYSSDNFSSRYSTAQPVTSSVTRSFENDTADGREIPDMDFLSDPITRDAVEEYMAKGYSTSVENANLVGDFLSQRQALKDFRAENLSGYFAASKSRVEFLESQLETHNKEADEIYKKIDELNKLQRAGGIGQAEYETAFAQLNQALDEKRVIVDGLIYDYKSAAALHQIDADAVAFNEWREKAYTGNFVGYTWNKLVGGSGEYGVAGLFSGIKRAENALNSYAFSAIYGKDFANYWREHEDERLKRIVDRDVDLMRHSGTTKEYEERFTNQNLITQAYGGVLGSVPSMVIPGAGSTAAFFFTAYDQVMNDFDQDPLMDDVPYYMKDAYAVTIGAAVSALERAGLRGIKGKQIPVSSWLINKSLRKIAPNSGELVAAEALEAEIRGTIKGYGNNLINAFLTEGETETLQQAVEDFGKFLINNSEGESFQPYPETFEEYANKMAHTYIVGAIGGVQMRGILDVARFRADSKIAKTGRVLKHFEALERIAKDEGLESNMMNILGARIKTGEITEADAKWIEKNYKAFRNYLDKMPDDASTYTKIKVLGLMQERDNLMSKIRGKEPSLVEKEQKRLEEIDKEISEVPNTEKFLEEIQKELVPEDSDLMFTQDEGVAEYNGMFSTDNTGMGQYNQYLERRKKFGGYFFFGKGMNATIKMMSPDAYLEATKEGFGTKEVEGLDAGKQQAILDGVAKGDKIHMPVLSYRGGNFHQEGRNRAMVAKQRGESMIPVLVERSVSMSARIDTANKLIQDALSLGAKTQSEVKNYLKDVFHLHRDAIRFIQNNADYFTGKTTKPTETDTGTTKQIGQGESGVQETATEGDENIKVKELESQRKEALSEAEGDADKIESINNFYDTQVANAKKKALDSGVISAAAKSRMEELSSERERLNKEYTEDGTTDKRRDEIDKRLDELDDEQMVLAHEIDGYELATVIFNRVVRNIAKREGKSENEVRENMTMRRTQNSIEEEAGEELSTLTRNMGNEQFANPTDAVDEGGEILFQGMSPGEMQDFVDDEDAYINPDLYTAMALSDAVQEEVKKLKEAAVLPLEKRQEINRLKKQMAPLYKEGRVDEAFALKERIKEIKDSVKPKKMTIERVENLLITDMKIAARLSEETNLYYLQDYTDEYIDRAIKFERYENNNELQAQAWERIKSNPEYRRRQVELTVSAEQKPALTASLSYLITEARGYGVERSFLVMKSIMNHVYIKGQKFKRGPNTVASVPLINGETMPIIDQRLNIEENFIPDLDLALIIHEAAKEALTKNALTESEMSSLKEKYRWKDIEEGTWVKIPQKGTEEDVINLKRLAAESHLTGDEDLGHWCTGAALGTAQSHNSSGDFYLFIDNKNKVKLAARYESQLGRMAETMRGLGSGQAVLPEDNEVAEDFMKNLAPENSDFLKNTKFNRIYNKIEKGEEWTTEDYKIAGDVRNAGDGSYNWQKNRQKINAVNKKFFDAPASFLAELYGVKEEEVLVVGSSTDFSKVKVKPKFVRYISGLYIDRIPEGLYDKVETLELSSSAVASTGEGRSLNRLFELNLPSLKTIKSIEEDIVFSGDARVVLKAENLKESKGVQLTSDEAPNLEYTDSAYFILEDIISPIKEARSIVIGAGNVTLVNYKGNSDSTIKIIEPYRTDSVSLSAPSMVEFSVSSSESIPVTLDAPNLEYLYGDLSEIDLKFKIGTGAKIKTLDNEHVQSMLDSGFVDFPALERIYGDGDNLTIDGKDVTFRSLKEASNLLVRNNGSINAPKLKKAVNIIVRDNGKLNAPNLEQIEDLTVSNSRLEIPSVKRLGFTRLIGSSYLKLDNLKVAEEISLVNENSVFEALNLERVLVEIAGAGAIKAPNVKAVGVLSNGVIKNKKTNLKNLDSIKLLKREKNADGSLETILDLRSLSSLKYINQVTGDGGSSGYRLISDSLKGLGAVYFTPNVILDTPNLVGIKDMIIYEDANVSNLKKLRVVAALEFYNSDVNAFPKSVDTLGNFPNLGKGFKLAKHLYDTGQIKHQYYKPTSDNKHIKDYFLSLEDFFIVSDSTSEVDAYYYIPEFVFKNEEVLGDAVLYQEAKGALIRAAGKETILLGEKSDFTTPLHEIAHAFETRLTEDEKTAVMKWTGQKEWNRDTSEAFAKGFEKYLYEGASPNVEAQSIFKKFANFLKEIIKDAAEYFGSINELNDDMRNIYDAMVATNQEGAAKELIELQQTLSMQESERESFDEFIDRLNDVIKTAKTEKPFNETLNFAKIAPVSEVSKYILNTLTVGTRAVSKDILTPLDQLVEELAQKWGDNIALMVRAANEYRGKNGIYSAAVRKTAGVIKNLFGEAVHTKESSTRKRRFIGMKNYANKYALDFAKNAMDIIGESNYEGLERVHRVLDPELYDEIAEMEENELSRRGIEGEQGSRPRMLAEPRPRRPRKKKKVKRLTVNDLSPREKQLYEIVRMVNDQMHEWNFKNGFIDKQTYDAFKGKYIARMYEEYEIGETGLGELASTHSRVGVSSKAGKALSKTVDSFYVKMFKKRRAVGDVKNMAFIKNPVYLTSKRLMQMIRNKAILEYVNQVAADENITISDTPFPNSVKLEAKQYTRSKDDYEAFQGIVEETDSEVLERDLARVGEETAVTEYEEPIDVEAEDVTGLPETLGKGQIYGKLTNKYVPNWLAEDLTGYFFTNKALDLIYDAFKLYDRTTTRQFLKSLHTTFSPVVSLGNMSSNLIFAFASGIDPLTFAVEYAKMFKAVAMNIGVRLPKAIITGQDFEPYKMTEQDSEYWDYLTKEGIIGTGIIVGDLMKKSLGSKIKDDVLEDKRRVIRMYSAAKKRIGDPAAESAREIYSFADDYAKFAAFKILKEKYRMSDEEASHRVYKGFQNYAMVGKLYDFASKTPIYGNPYVKFAGDLMRIAKNSVTSRPLHTMAYLATIQVVGNLLAQLSGEDDDDMEARLARPYTPFIPFRTDWISKAVGQEPKDFQKKGIPLLWRVGDYEFNVARFASPIYYYQDNKTKWYEKISKYMPYQLEAPPSADGTSGVIPRIPEGDVFLGVYMSVLLDKDFRDMSIADGGASYFRRSGKTEGEKLLSVADYIARSQMPFGAMFSDMWSVYSTGTDYYGREKTFATALGSKFIKFREWDKEIANTELKKYYDAIDYERNNEQRIRNGINSELEERAVLIYKREGISETRKKEMRSDLYEKLEKRYFQSIERENELLKEQERIVRYSSNLNAPKSE